MTLDSEYSHAYEQQPCFILSQGGALAKSQCCFMGVVKSQTVAAVNSPVDRTTTNYFLFHSTLSKVTWCPDAKKVSQPRSMYSSSISP